jgi:hypothetical protein
LTKWVFWCNFLFTVQTYQKQEKGQMKIKIITIVLVLAVLASSITACKPKDSYLVQVMKLVPEDTYVVTCSDLKQMTEDPDFTAIYNSMISSLSYQTVGVAVSDISVLAYIETDYLEDIFVLIGDFDLEEARDALTTGDFVEGEYRGIEIWTDEYEDAVAFIGNMVVSGYSDEVEACIRRHKNEESSMYDNKEMKSIAARLPSGVISVIFGPDYFYDIEILAGGICVHNQQRDDEVLDITGWFKFDSEASAEAAMEDIEDALSRIFDATNIEASLSGQLIEITGEAEIPEF